MSKTSPIDHGHGDGSSFPENYGGGPAPSTSVAASMAPSVAESDAAAHAYARDNPGSGAVGNAPATEPGVSSREAHDVGQYPAAAGYSSES